MYGWSPRSLQPKNRLDVNKTRHHSPRCVWQRLGRQFSIRAFKPNTAFRLNLQAFQKSARHFLHACVAWSKFLRPQRYVLSIFRQRHTGPWSFFLFCHRVAIQWRSSARCYNITTPQMDGLAHDSRIPLDLCLTLRASGKFSTYGDVTKDGYRM